MFTGTLEGAGVGSSMNFINIHVLSLLLQQLLLCWAILLKNIIILLVEYCVRMPNVCTFTGALGSTDITVVMSGSPSRILSVKYKAR